VDGKLLCTVRLHHVLLPLKFPGFAHSLCVLYPEFVRFPLYLSTGGLMFLLCVWPGWLDRPYTWEEFSSWANREQRQVLHMPCNLSVRESEHRCWELFTGQCDGAKIRHVKYATDIVGSLVGTVPRGRLRTQNGICW
jgi:hypothetical protein